MTPAWEDAAVCIPSGEPPTEAAEREHLAEYIKRNPSKAREGRAGGRSAAKLPAKHRRREGEEEERDGGGRGGDTTRITMYNSNMII